jgi:hypothetical protein
MLDPAFILIPGDIAEHLQDPSRCRSRRHPAFGENRESTNPLPLHGLTNGAFDQRIEHHGQECGMKKSDDPLGLLEIDRRDAQLGLEERMPLLYVGLILVDLQNLLAGLAFEVGQKRKDPIGSGGRPKGQRIPADRKDEFPRARFPQRRPRLGPAGLKMSDPSNFARPELGSEPRPMRTENRSNFLLDRGPAPVRAFVQARGQVVKFRFDPAQAGLPGRGIEGRLLRTPEPDQAKSVGTARVGGRPINVRRIVLASGRQRQGAPPTDAALTQPDPHGPVLGPGPGQHGHEPPLIMGQIGQILPGAQLAVGDIDEIVPAEQVTKTFEVGPVDRVVGPVAAVDIMGERDRPVGRDVQPEDELLEVRTVVLVVMWLAT